MLGSRKSGSWVRGVVLLRSALSGQVAGADLVHFGFVNVVWYALFLFHQTAIRLPAAREGLWLICRLLLEACSQFRYGQIPRLRAGRLDSIRRDRNVCHLYTDADETLKAFTSFNETLMGQLSLKYEVHAQHAAYNCYEYHYVLAAVHNHAREYTGLVLIG